VQKSGIRGKILCMKRITLLEVAPEELGGQPTTPGSELVLRGIRYRVVQARTRVARVSKWRREPRRDEKCQLLVEVVSNRTIPGSRFQVRRW
jgi:hypothetical protein